MRVQSVTQLRRAAHDKRVIEVVRTRTGVCVNVVDASGRPGTIRIDNQDIPTGVNVLTDFGQAREPRAVIERAELLIGAHNEQRFATIGEP